MLGSPDEAQDALQEAFVKAWQSLPRFDVERPFGPWFFRILRNHCRDVIRSQRSRSRFETRDEKLELRPAGVSSDPEYLQMKTEAKELLWKALSEVGDEHREILVLKELEDLRYAEIASILDVPEGTVASRLYHARRALRSVLLEMNVEYP
jgi:RNA polymerase sigma-70 factor (ECF subfamily)